MTLSRPLQSFALVLLAAFLVPPLVRLLVRGADEVAVSTRGPRAGEAGGSRQSGG